MPDQSSDGIASVTVKSSAPVSELRIVSVKSGTVNFTEIVIFVRLVIVGTAAQLLNAYCGLDSQNGMAVSSSTPATTEAVKECCA